MPEGFLIDRFLETFGSDMLKTHVIVASVTTITNNSLRLFQFPYVYVN